MTLILPIDFPFTNPVLIVATVMAMILFAPQIAARFRIPGVVGLILAGALAGPSAFDMLQRDATMVLLGTIGLMYLMFVAGVSLDLNGFRKVRSRSLVFGLVSFFVPQIITMVVALKVLGFSMPAALLLGSITGSHTLIAYPIAARLGLNKNVAVTMTLGGTLVTDSVSLAILAIVIAAHGGNGGVGFWAGFGTMVVAYAAFIVFGLPRIGHWFFRTVQNKPEVEFAFLMTVLFGSAFLAEFVGLAPIIGAFLAGIAINRLIPEQSLIMTRIKFTGEALFIPFFLISVGLLIDFRVLFESLEVWRLALVLIALVCVGKWLAAYIVERAYGYSRDEGWLVFGLSIPQAAATLAVTLIGFEVGLFEQVLVNAVVVMILVTCILGPWLVEKHGLAIVHRTDVEPASPSSAPERILVPLANPQTSDNLIDLALLMRDPDSAQPLYALMVVSEGFDVEQRLVTKHERLNRVVDRAVEANVPVVPMTRIDPNIAQGIGRAACEERISVIHIGWNGEITTRERIFGTVLDQLLEETRQMVFVNKLDHPVNTTSHIVLAIPPFAERSPGFFEAIHAVKLMALRVDAALTVVCEQRYLEHDTQFVRSTRPDLQARFVPVESWARLAPTLSKLVDATTHIVAVSARRGTAPWIPELDGIPRLIAQSYPHQSFSIVYLPES